MSLKGGKNCQQFLVCFVLYQIVVTDGHAGHVDVLGLSKFHFEFLFRGMSCSVLTDAPSGVGEDARDGAEGRGDNQDQSGGGSKAGGVADSNTQDVDSIHSSQGGDEHSITEYEIVRAVLYSTRENVNIVHECFRQVRLCEHHHHV